jgi:hypothetical protein
MGRAVTTRTSIGSLDGAGAIGLAEGASARAIKPIATMAIATAMITKKMMRVRFIGVHSSRRSYATPAHDGRGVLARKSIAT